jgi:glycosyltransferase involved in cell wall biosynthesis
LIGGKRVSGFVITYNEEANIADCLESIRWADELVVVDSYSEDGTVDLARRYTDRVIQRPFEGYVSQASFAFEQTTGDWVIWLDADERLTPEATEEARAFLEMPDAGGYDGFAFKRKTWFLGRWITHGGWYPQYRVRLMRRQAAAITGQEPHIRAVVAGRTKRLKGEILHFSYPGGILDYVRRSADHAERGALTRFRAGRRFSWVRFLLEPPLVFLKSYFLGLGLLDGLAGFVVAVGTAHYRFIRNVRLWELEAEPAAGDASGGEQSAEDAARREAEPAGAERAAPRPGRRP